MVELLTHGLGAPGVGSALLHASMGVFFAASGWNKLTNGERHRTLVETFKADHVPFIRFNQWWVPSWEFLGGGMLMFGLWPAFAAGVLFIICVVATLCEGPRRVRDFGPINAADRAADWLYLPEVLYGLMLAAITLGV